MTDAMLTEPVPVAAPPSHEDEPLFEIIDGQRVELPPMSQFAARLGSRLLIKVAGFNDAHDLGEVVGEVLFCLPLDKDRNRRPDVAFVSYKRWPKGKPSNRAENAWHVVPDLAVEVVSPTDRAEEVMDKVREYCQAGVDLVWVFYPTLQLVTVYETLARIRVLTAADELDGGSVLPGFRLPLGPFFAELPAEA
jgi:Uma2 family endonuclease